jgi:hypothetical protein
MSRRGALVGLCLLPGLAIAQEAPPAVPAQPPVDATAHRHLGFYSHVDLGAAFFLTEAASGELGAGTAGAAVLVSVAAGGAATEDWILAGEIWGVAVPSSTSTDSSTVALGGFGLNVTHYFMPANVFLTLTPSATVLAVDKGNGTIGSSAIGFGVRVALGKEWSVGDHWGLGVAAQGLLAINRDQGASAPTWWTVGGGIVFSATYN